MGINTDSILNQIWAKELVFSAHLTRIRKKDSDHRWRRLPNPESQRERSLHMIPLRVIHLQRRPLLLALVSPLKKCLYTSLNKGWFQITIAIQLPSHPSHAQLTSARPRSMIHSQCSSQILNQCHYWEWYRSNRVREHESSRLQKDSWTLLTSLQSGEISTYWLPIELHR